ncbi:putative GntR family transcriptional regulator [Gordonia araii NBRC 100433]|uniref:Putative GntR family transcriptional regulator n=1 Tax=Gordonia araii NBRC 100433 TaxID=1073574 RepID=G7H0X1_9ACTN|nr:FadR/GntR family transcriptional regulator [Gordonia araii]NNG97292.1 FadR family transcriptional regulator [Gordonia araii NBRC 100433]GAB09496.1 putative GntR family transcriptional regulator [Gordonia araii NBRC 100433]
MTFQPVVRRSVSEDVYDQIAARVVSGDLPVGGSLPSERDLAAALGVSRPAVREALKRLDGSGLVHIRQGDATTVRDIRREGGLDLLPLLLVAGGQLDLSVARSVIEARAQIAPIVAGLAAERIADADVQPLRTSVDEIATVTDPLQLQVLALQFWDQIVDGAQSVVYRLMFNSLRSAYEPALPALSMAMAGEVGKVDAYRDLVDAVAAHDPDAARRAADDLLTPSTTELLRVFDSVDETQGGHDGH